MFFFEAATLPVSCARGAKVGADGKRAVGDVVEAYVPNVGGAGFAQGWLQAKVVKVFVNGTLVFFFNTHQKKNPRFKKKCIFKQNVFCLLFLTRWCGRIGRGGWTYLRRE